MADLTITQANVQLVSGSMGTGTAGATVTAGQALYSDSGDSGKLKPGHAETSLATATIVGIALSNASDGQPIAYARAGSVINPGATVVVGKMYVLSTSGLIAPVDDLATADWVSYLFYATASNRVTLVLDNTGVQVP